MLDYTDELSFILRPSSIEGAGIGLFTQRDFKKGELVFDRETEKLVEKTPEQEFYDIWDYDEYGNDMETYHREYTTPLGEKIVAFGYFGQDN